jgi:hypothetical protein
MSTALTPKRRLGTVWVAAGVSTERPNSGTVGRLLRVLLFIEADLQKVAVRHAKRFAHAAGLFCQRCRSDFHFPYSHSSLSRFVCWNTSQRKSRESLEWGSKKMLPGPAASEACATRTASWHTTGVKMENSDQVGAIPLEKRNRLLLIGREAYRRNLCRRRNPSRRESHWRVQHPLVLSKRSRACRGDGRPRRWSRSGGAAGSATAARCARGTLSRTTGVGWQDARVQHHQRSE